MTDRGKPAFEVQTNTIVHRRALTYFGPTCGSWFFSDSSLFPLVLLVTAIPISPSRAE
jgi:hypothetical protein